MDYTREISTNAALSDEVLKSANWGRKILETGLTMSEFIKKSLTFTIFIFDSITPTESVIRSVQIFIKLLSSLSIWDYLLWKKTRRTEELFIRSAVTTTIEIDSEL